MKKGTHAVQDQHWKKLRARTAKAPQRPGIYRWLDAEGNILYIGKAKNLRKRLKTYLPKAGLPRTQAARPVSERSEWYRERVVRGPWKEALLEKIADVDWTLTANELEALILETNLIKEHRPKFNVLMKDDKNYVYVKITTEEAYPRIEIVRRLEEDRRPRGAEGALRGDARYFGPFLSGYDLRETLDLLHTVFAWRACKRSLDLLNRASIRPSTSLGATQHDTKLKECLEYQIGKCNGLCIGRLTQEEYRKRISEVIRFFRGDRSEVIEHLKRMMQETAAAKQFEKAAKFRNTLAHIQSLEEQQIISGTSGANTDVFGVAFLKDRSQVVLLKERGGKVVNELSFTLTGSAEGTSDVLSQFLPQYYLSTQDIPDTILIKEPFEGQSSLEIWLSGKRQASSGKQIKIVVPARGKKSKLLRMAEENAAEKVEQQFAAWEAETLKVERALQELKKALHLKEIPKRIECYDISHLGGTETVGSMVVAIDGKLRSDHYRSFTLRTIRKGEIDDYKALREVLTRRLRHLTERAKEWLKQIPIALEKRGKLYVVVHSALEGTYAERGFRYVRIIPRELKKKMEEETIVMMLEKKNKPDPSLTATPDLLILDGGKGQLGVGVEVLKRLDLAIPVISLAKEHEEVFIPGQEARLAHHSLGEGGFLLMRLRDEAHRFANRHRERRTKHALVG